MVIEYDGKRIILAAKELNQPTGDYNNYSTSIFLNGICSDLYDLARLYRKYESDNELSQRYAAILEEKAHCIFQQLAETGFYK